MDKPCLILLVFVLSGSLTHARQSPSSSDLADVPLEQLLRLETPPEEKPEPRPEADSRKSSIQPLPWRVSRRFLGPVWDTASA